MALELVGFAHDVIPKSILLQVVSKELSKQPCNQP
jgi:hypothetical protein